MSLIADYSNVKVEYILAPKYSEYVRILDSIEVYGRDRQTQNEKENGAKDWDITELPDVWRYTPAGSRPMDFVSMTEKFQHWIFRINLECLFGRRMGDEEYTSFWQEQLVLHKKDKSSVYIRWFNQLFFSGRAFNNKAGVDKCKNFIAQENMEADYPKFFHVVTGRFVGKLIGNERLIGGVPHVGMECIHGGGNYLQYHPFTHPHLFDKPIVTGRTLLYGKGGYSITEYWWRIFHHFQQKVVVPFILPFDSVAFYPKNKLKIPSDREPGMK